ncbi:MAG: GNAT family N-acetyltransferase [Acidilobus sp.]
MLSRVKVSFERVTAEDREAVERLLRSAPEVQLMGLQGLFDRWLSEGLFIKAVDAYGSTVGVIHVRQAGDAVWLEGIAVSQDIRRKGIGRQLALYAMEASGGSVFRVMASARNVPSNALALALGFREVDRVYFSDGRRAAAAEMASELGLAEVSPSLEEVPGVVSDWAWVPSGLYRGKAYGGRGLLLLDTDPPFFARGDAEGYRRLSRERSSGAEELIVYELRRA